MFVLRSTYRKLQEELANGSKRAVGVIDKLNAGLQAYSDQVDTLKQLNQNISKEREALRVDLNEAVGRVVQIERLLAKINLLSKGG